MNRTITVTLCDRPEDMGPGGTAADVASYLDLVKERLAIIYPVANIAIETSPQAGTWVHDSHDQEHDVHDAIQRAWEAWCLGERADADETGTTLCEVST